MAIVKDLKKHSSTYRTYKFILLTGVGSRAWVRGEVEGGKRGGGGVVSSVILEELLSIIGLYL